MSTFISDLYLHYPDQLSYPKDPERLAVIEQYHTLEDQIETEMGKDFLSKFQQSEHNKTWYELEESFQKGLQVGIQFIGALLGPQ